MNLQVSFCRDSIKENQDGKNNQERKKKLKKPVFSHDKLFKNFYNDPKLAVELLPLIFTKSQLALFDLSQLKVEKNTLELKIADLILSLPFKESLSCWIRLFVLLEHKSYYDKGLFSQLLSYQTAIREQSLKEKSYVEPIIPVLFYHGKEPMRWKKSLQEEDFKAFFSKIPVGLRKYMLNYRIKIIDINDRRIFKKTQKGRSKGVVKLLTEVWRLKKPSSGKVRDIIKDDFGDLIKKESAEEAVRIISRVMKYLEDTTGFEEWEQTKSLLLEEGLLTKGGKNMDIEEHFREEGRWEGMQEGIQKGRQEGIQKGRQENQRELIMNMLKKKMDISFISEVTGLSKEKILKLKAKN